MERVRQRVLREFDETKLGDDLPEEVRAVIHKPEEPLRGLIHGLPGTGKSKVIEWICRLFEGALNWKNGDQFICVAFQNRMATAINGSTLHNAGDLPRPSED